MLSTTIRTNEREIGVLMTALAKYNAGLITETKDTIYVTEEFKHIARLLEKLSDARIKLKRNI